MLRRAGLLAALTALLVPAVAGTTANAKTRGPVVTRITPKHVFVGETLTIRGHHFRRGLNKNTVAFKRAGAKAVFVKAEKGTTKMLRVKLPKRLESVLQVKNGTPTPTALRCACWRRSSGSGSPRARSRRSSALRSRRLRRSPSRSTRTRTATATAPPTARHRRRQRPASRHAREALRPTRATSTATATASRTATSTSRRRTSTTTSTRTRTRTSRTRPRGRTRTRSTRPTPTPITTATALTLEQEYRLWKYSIAHSGEPRTLERLSYSAGEQYSKSARAGGTGVRTPTLLADGYDKQASFLAWAGSHSYGTVSLADIGTDLWDPQSEWYAPRAPVADTFDIRDANRDHVVSGAERLYYNDSNPYLDDAERDEDGDGLSNFDETTGCMNRPLWDSLYKDEKPYTLSYPGTDFDDADTDGDGVLDGADDQDHDDIPNIMECSRALAGNTGLDARTATIARPGLPSQAWVNPYNPCLPHWKSRTCPVALPVNDTPFAPFDEAKRTAGKYYFIWN